MKRKISWSDIWHADASRLKFLVQSVYDVLPSPANLFTWRKSGIPSFLLCAGKGTLRHIMSACPMALGDRRYYLPTPPLGQDMTQGQFLSGV